MHGDVTPDGQEFYQLLLVQLIIVQSKHGLGTSSIVPFKRKGNTDKLILTKHELQAGKIRCFCGFNIYSI